MSYKARNILFAIFIIMFVVMTTFFSLYASGYRVSFIGIFRGQALIQKTGILVVASTPRGADIFLSGNFRGIFSDDVLRSRSIRTPNKIKGLLPGEYDLTLKLDGYWPFERKVIIEPGYSTYIEDIILFRRSLPVIFFNSSPQKIALNNDGSKIILEKDNILIDTENGKRDDIELGEDIDKLIFLDNRRALIDDKIVFNYIREEIDASLEDVDKIKVKNNIIFYLDKEGLKSYNISSQKKERIFLKDGIIDYDFYSGYYFLVLSRSEKKYIQIYSYRSKELVREISLPDFGDYEIISQDSNSPFVYIYEKKFNTMYVINTASRLSTYWSVVNNVKGFDFIDGNSFVYFTDFEIYTFNSIVSDRFLIGRFENSTKSIVWHPKDYIVYTNRNDIFILDLKHDNQLIKLVSLEWVSNLLLDKRRGILYFSGKIANQEGVYRLFIQ
jgi:hypothetical protein